MIEILFFRYEMGRNVARDKVLIISKPSFLAHFMMYRKHLGNVEYFIYLVSLLLN
jgi:hypothetical protein